MATLSDRELDLYKYHRLVSTGLCCHQEEKHNIPLRNQRKAVRVCKHCNVLPVLLRLFVKLLQLAHATRCAELSLVESRSPKVNRGGDSGEGVPDDKPLEELLLLTGFGYHE